MSKIIQMYFFPFEYRDRQIGKILDAEQTFEVIALIDNFVSIKCKGHEGYPLDATIFKLFAEKGMTKNG